MSSTTQTVAAKPDTPLTLVVVRHGQTAWNAEGRLQGQTDIPLADLGRRQARSLGRRLASAWSSPSRVLPGLPTAVYTSDLSRARETLELALGPVRADHPAWKPAEVVTPLLRERHFGVWEGLTAEEARAKFGPTRSHRNEGEPQIAVRERMETMMRRIEDEIPVSAQSRIALIVGHGGSLRHLVSVAIGLPIEAAHLFHLDNTGLSVLTVRGETGTMQLWNDTAHLVYDP